jgi:hypothetical protein
MCAEGTRQASAEIEVTPDMVKAGATALFCGGYEPGDNDGDVAAKVYRAMELVRLAQESGSRAESPVLRQQSTRPAPQS